MFGPILGLLLPLAVIIALIRAFQGRRDFSGEAPTISVRRFFHYVALLGLAIITLLGLAGLIAQVLPEADTLVRRTSSAEAQALAFTIIGGPLFVAMAFWTRRRLEADPNEARSLGWVLYLTAMQLIGLAVVMTVGVRSIDWAVADGALDTADVAHGLVWLVSWVVHWAIAARAIEPERMNPHLIAGSVAGLGVLVTGVARALSAALEYLYSELFDVVLVGDLDDVLLDEASLVVVGAAVWIWYWLSNGARAERTTLWNVYVLLVGVLGGMLTTLASAGVLIAMALQWLIGDVGSTARHFDVYPNALTALLIGAAAWVYHRSLLASGQRSDVHRSYEYLVTGVGVVAIAAGIGTTVVALLDAATETADELLLTSGEERALVVAITLLLLGVPLWWISWRRIRRRAALDPDIEIRSVVRRVYLFALIGVGAVTSIVALIVLVYTVLQDALDGNLGTQSVRDAEASIGVLLAALAVTGYHWTVYQEDRALYPEETRVRLREVVYVGVDGRDMVKAIAGATGARVHVWNRGDDVGESPVPTEVVEALKRLDEERVLVIQTARGSFEVIPLRR